MQRSVVPIVIICCGNEAAGPDGFGPAVARALKADPPSGAEVVDLALDPSQLADHLGGREALVVVDAIVCPGVRAGRLWEWDLHDIADGRVGGLTSTHGLSVPDEIRLCQTLGILPPIVRGLGLAVRPRDLTPPHALSSIQPSIIVRAERRLRGICREICARIDQAVPPPQCAAAGVEP